MSVKIGTPKIAYGKTVIFDTPGNHTFIHPSPGKNIEVFVELIGAAGGCQSNVMGTTYTTATDGGDSIWDTGGSNTTSAGGGAAPAYFTPGVGFIYGISSTSSAYSLSHSIPIMDGLYGNAGNILQNDDSSPYTTIATGGSGYVKRFNTTISGNINITVGAAGTQDTPTTHVGPSQGGACIVHYNVLDNEVPVTVSNPPEVDHYLEFSWRAPKNTPNQSLVSDTLTTLTLDTEVLDTGNYGSINGSNEFTLDAGTYEFIIEIPVIAPEIGDFIGRLYNVSDSTLVSSVSYARVGTGGAGKGSDNVRILGVFKIGSQKTFKLEGIATSSAGVRDIGLAILGTDTSLADRTKITLTRKAYS
jgi:hypothetical protein